MNGEEEKNIFSRQKEISITSTTMRGGISKKKN